MNKKKLIIIAVSIVIVAILTVCICDFAEWKHDFVYRELEDGTLELKKYNGEENIVVIPETVFGKKVTRIGDSCFDFIPVKICRVEIPDTVTSVGEWAFEGCEDLIILGGENLEVIEKGAFGNCVFAEPFPFSEKLTYLGDWAFFGCSDMGGLVLNENGEEEVRFLSNISYIGKNALNNTWLKNQECYIIVGDNILINIPEKEVQIIPSDIKTIALQISRYNTMVKEIYISDDVEDISGAIYFGTDEALTIYIPSGVKNISKVYDEETNNIVAEDMDKVTLVVEKGSYGEEYAKQKAQEYGTKYKVVDRIEYPVEK